MTKIVDLEKEVLTEESADKLSEENMNIVIVGHVDHGKSTIIGRLLADTNSLPKGKLEQVKETCRRNSKPFEYSFLLDALKDEQAQGITIDSARVFFKTKKRKYIIIDAPGHIEFLKNMVTGASRAEAALLVIDANEGVQENSKRHGYLLSMLGIRQIVVLVNKMDLIGYDEERYYEIVKEYNAFLKEIGVNVDKFIPVSGYHGDFIVKKTDNLSWFDGETVLEVLDAMDNSKLPIDEVFRMPVQDIYKFTNNGDNRRIVAGTIETGKISVGDEIIFYPSGKKSSIKSIEYFNGPVKTEDYAGSATGFTLTEQIYITRGELACKSNELKPQVATRISTKLFWLGVNDLVEGRQYFLKNGTAKVQAKIEKVVRVLDASSLVSKESNRVKRHEVAEVIIETIKPIAFDLTKDLANTSRFVIIDDYEISGGGIIQETLEDEQTWIREKVLTRNYKWENSHISKRQRAERFGQKPTLVLITGNKDVNKKEFAKYVESRMFAEGRLVYYLGMSNLLYGLGADIKVENSMENRQEHIRRLAEISHIMLDAGHIVIVSATDINNNDIDILKNVMKPDEIKVIWLGDYEGKETNINLHLDDESFDSMYLKLKTMLQEDQIIFNMWE
ncbi:adenylyl-sulfate kinase [Vulcanibacillus modesticaldus]|uniref:sulfate adenylyltransferase n=1 Tax=Vulcanibacillus modesticaldus TaxID=337097 RepID=A0A1D2YVT9_9BACI|nr:GTP-binding protein [Vulcanibacillus modesticaldus]OEF99783.1 adenylyl-sulfate kinase [Vulcanibacillus modesticaldus]